MREPAGLILAGGRGTRMGGVAKADLLLGGERLLDLCIDRLDPQVSAIAVNSNAAVKSPFPVVSDTLKGHLGPLAGILAGLEWAHEKGHDHVVSVAVDTPFFPCDLVPHLLMASTETGFAICATSDGAHGTFGLWPVSLIPDLTEFLTSGGRKVRAFTDLHGAGVATFPDTTPPAFFNINTPADLAQATAWL